MRILNMKKIVKLFSVLLLLSMITGCNHEQVEDIYILYTNDVASALDNGVSYAGVKKYKDDLSSQHRYVSLVDAGDFFDGDVGLKSKGKYIVEIMNAVGYDVVTLGNQEFSIGLDGLSQSIKESDFTYVSCNLKYIGSGRNPLNKVKDYTILNYGGTKIAFIGVTTPETLIPGKRAYEAINVNGKLVYDFYEGDDGHELYNRVQKIVDKVRKKVDYVIVLAHLGSNGVTEGFSSYDLIHNTTGIDVVIDGHSHNDISGEAVNNLEGSMVVLTSTGQHLDTLGELTIHKDHTYTTTLYRTDMDRDSYVQSIVDSVYARLAE